MRSGPFKKLAAATLLGAGFGFLISWGQFTDPDRIREMLLFEDLYLYEMMFSAMAIGFVGIRLLRRRGIRRHADGRAGELARENRHHRAEQREPEGQQKQQDPAVAEGCARRPPDNAVATRRKGRRGIRRQHREPRQRAVGQDGCDLQRDDKAGTDDGGNDLRDQPGPARADEAKQQHGDRDRHRERSRPADL